MIAKIRNPGSPATNAWSNAALDFRLENDLLAGCAERVSRGEIVSSSEIPVQDDETSRQVMELRRKADLSDEERAFLQYFELLEEISASLHRLRLH